MRVRVRAMGLLERSLGLVLLLAVRVPVWGQVRGRSG